MTAFRRPAFFAWALGALAIAAPAASAAGFRPPAIDPAGAVLETVKLSTGVYALMASRSPVDNAGFVVGSRGVLVVDSHVNGRMADAILQAVRRVTALPVFYLAYTNFHGDHTYGSHRFPPSVRVVAHRMTDERMKDGADEMRLMSALTGWSKGVLDDEPPRRADIVFDGDLVADLGGVRVELRHFGFGNTPGDTVVWVPEASVAFTGNLVLGDGTVPFVLEGGVGRYRATLERMAAAIAPRVIVPGHGPMTSGAIVGRYIAYLADLEARVKEAVRAGKSVGETAAAVDLKPEFARGDAGDGPSFMAGSFHTWNVRAAYDEESGRPVVKAYDWPF